jgi:hypothetical protein
MAPQELPLEQPVPTASGPPPPLADDPLATVEQLYTDLVERRAALGLPTPPRAPDDACQPVCKVDDPPGVPSTAPGCTPGAGSACVSACAQADATCDDAAKICAIAKKNLTEARVAARCHDARATCTDASAPCCSCK